MAGDLVIRTINSKDISSSLVATESQVIGVGQTWQAVTASRVAGTTYTNSTGKPIYVSINISVSGTPINTLTIGGIIADSLYVNSPYQNRMQLKGIVPNGATYILSNVSITSIVLWSELR